MLQREKIHINFFFYSSNSYIIIKTNQARGGCFEEKSLFYYVCWSTASYFLSFLCREKIRMGGHHRRRKRSHTGDFIKEHSVAKYFPLVRVRTDQKGHFAIQYLFRDEKIIGYKIILLDSNLELVSEIASVERKQNPPRVMRLIGPLLQYMVTNDGQILMGYSEDYELRFLSQNGDLVKKKSLTTLLFL